MTQPNDFPPQQELPFLSHLVEMRDRLLRVVLVVVVIFLALFSFANDLYTLLAEPLLRHMPTGTSMIATEVASPFLTPFKLTLVLSVFIAIPFILYQAWGFIAPALYQKEKKLVFPLLLSSTLLFYLGMTFAYFVVFPLVFGFLTGVVPEGVAVMTDISRYLDFVLKMFFAFGLAFEVPIATILVIWSGMTTAKQLAAKRPYIIVGAFVLGMLLTPPDVISQTLLALPMWFLFEMGLIFSKMYTRPESDGEGDNDADNDTGNNADNQPDTPDSGPDETPENDTKPDTGTSSSEDSNDELSAYSEADEEYTPLDEDEIDDELDRLEAEESLNNEDKEEHPEFEPMPDKSDDDGSGSSPDTDKQEK